MTEAQGTEIIALLQSLSAMLEVMQIGFGFCIAGLAFLVIVNASQRKFPW